MEKNFDFAGKSFQLRRLDAFKQFHIVRRIGPILAEMLPQMKNLKNAESLSESEKLENFAKIAGPVMAGFSKLSDADAEFVLYGLLAAVEVKQPASGNWAQISTGSMLMIQDLDLPMMMQLAGRALMFNLSGFFSVLPQ